MTLNAVWRKPARPKGTVIPARWFHLKPGLPLAFWMRVARIVKTRRINRRDLIKVREIVEETNQHKDK